MVDDDAATRLLVRSILEIAGHEVIEARHGSTALNLISPLSARSRPVTATIPIVVVSGNLVEAWTLKATGLVDAVVPKPFEAADLAQCIRAITGDQRTRRPLVA